MIFLIIPCAFLGAVKSWDPRVIARPVVQFIPETSLPSDCWAVLSPQSRPNLVYAGYSDGFFRIFDVRNAKMVSSHKLSSGICAADVNDGLPVVCSTQGGSITSVDVDTNGTISPLSSREKAHQGTSWSVKYVGSANVVSSGSAGDLKVWDVGARGRPPMPHLSSFPSHHSILSIDVLHKKPSIIVCASLDNTIRVLYFPL